MHRSAAVLSGMTVPDTSAHGKGRARTTPGGEDQQALMQYQEEGHLDLCNGPGQHKSGTYKIVNTTTSQAAGG